jgi:hypothetical protein
LKSSLVAQRELREKFVNERRADSHGPTRIVRDLRKHAPQLESIVDAQTGIQPVILQMPISVLLGEAILLRGAALLDVSQHFPNAEALESVLPRVRSSLVSMQAVAIQFGSICLDPIHEGRLELFEGRGAHKRHGTHAAGPCHPARDLPVRDERADESLVCADAILKTTAPAGAEDLDEPAKTNRSVSRTFGRRASAGHFSPEMMAIRMPWRRHTSQAAYSAVQTLRRIPLSKSDGAPKKTLIH